MQISQAIQQNIKKLAKTSNTPNIDAEVLLCFVLQKAKEYLYTYPEYELTAIEEKTYLDCITKRLSGVSVAYITGFKDFYGYEFIVSTDTLVPRPETEMFIDFVKKHHNDDKTTFIDIGTGSGCIIISLAKELRGIQQCKFYAVDISEKALDIARENAKKHNVDSVIKFHHGNLLKPLFNYFEEFEDDSSIVITANLPYLTHEQIKDAPSIQAEPSLALFAEDNGLKYYRELFKQITNIYHYKQNQAKLKNSNKKTMAKNERDSSAIAQNDSFIKNITILCEIDNSQADSITTLTKKELPNFSIKIKKDLNGLSRMVVIEKKQPHNVILSDSRRILFNL